MYGIFQILEFLPSFGSNRKKSETLILCAYRWSFLVLKILPVFRSSRKPIFLTKKTYAWYFFLVLKNLPDFQSYRNRFYLNSNFYSKFFNVNEQHKNRQDLMVFVTLKKKVAFDFVNLNFWIG